MSKRSDNGRIGSAVRTKGTKKVGFRQRRLGFEGLEERRLLSTVGLNSISNVTLPAGTSVLVALNGSDSGNTVKFGVTTSDPALVTPIVMPSTNPSLQFSIAGLGTMTFQLFANYTPNTVNHIEALVNANPDFYDGDYIYRAETGTFALVQGGNNPPQINSGANVNALPSGVPTSINEEFNPDLNYTAGGALAMARTTTPNSSGTEFFITDGPTRSLDYAYTYFGFQTGDQVISYQNKTTTVLQALDSSPTTNSNGIDYLNTPFLISSAKIITDTQDGVLMLRAPTGISGSYTVNVTAYDGTNTPTTRTFTVNVVPDSASGNTANPWASVTPSAPASVVFQPQSGQGSSTYTSANNSSTSKELRFLVSGVTIGNLVTVYADGVAIGSATATSTAQVVTTNGTATLPDGSHTFTATQTALNLSVADSGDSSQNESANVDSLDSAPVKVQVSTSLAVTSTPAATANVGQAYTYTLQTNAPSGDTVTVNQSTWTLPTGMTYNAATGIFTWKPSNAQLNTKPAFSATVTDALGNTASFGPVDISVGPGVAATEIPANSTSGGNVTVSFSGSSVLIYDNITHSALTSATFTSTDTVEIDAPSGQANSVLILVPTSGSAPLPQGVLVQGASGAANNTVTVRATSATNNFTLASVTTNGQATTVATANSLATTVALVQHLALDGYGSNDDFALNSSTTPTTVAVTGGYNTLDFSKDTAGVTVNLGLDTGRAQSIAPWGTTLSINGVIDKLIGSAYADTLTGGPAATTEIVSGGGNDKITGGSGDNILMGGGGNDTITGGPGKNLLIGGDGNDSLYAKGTQSIIFAGTTNIDGNDQELLDLLEQGSRASYGYSVRRILASAAKNPVSPSVNVTFQDTGATDTIFGNPANNWFVVGKNGKIKS